MTATNQFFVHFLSPQAVPDFMFFKKQSDKKDNDKDCESGIPSMATDEEEDGKSDVNSIELEANGPDTRSPGSIGEFGSSRTPDALDEDGLGCAQDTPTVDSLSSESLEENVAKEDPVNSPAIPRSLSSRNSNDVATTLTLPALEEECREEETLPSLKLAPNNKFTQFACCSNEESGQSDEASEKSDEEEYLCAICLCDYGK